MCFYLKVLWNFKIQITKKLFSDFLKGGKYFNSNVFLDDCSSCPTNNICVERLIGQFDFKLKYACTLTTNIVESSLMFNNNKSYDWLSEKSACEQKRITDISRKWNRNFSVEYKKKRELLFQRHIKILREKAEDSRKKKERKENKIERALKDMDKIGLGKWSPSRGGVVKIKNEKRKNKCTEDTNKHIPKSIQYCQGEQIFAVF